MDTEADRQAMIAAVGGVSVGTQSGEFMAVFEHEYVLAGEVEERQPILTATTADIDRLALKKSQVLTVAGVHYRVRRHEPDGTGMSRIYLEQA